MNKYYKENVDQIEGHEIKEFELYSVALDYLSHKYDLRPDVPLSYWIDCNCGEHYVSILIAFKDNGTNIFCYSVLYSKNDDENLVTVLERQTNSIVDLVKDIDGIMTLVHQGF